MATKKKPEKREGYMVRLPEKYRALLAAAKQKTRRNVGVEVEIALDAHLKTLGIESK